MVALTDLADDVLRKLAVLGADQTAESDDTVRALDKLDSVHGFLKAEGLVRWTKNDIPDYAKEPYILMAAYLCTDLFEMQPRPDWWAGGLHMIQSAVNVRNNGVTPGEYF